MCMTPNPLKNLSLKFNEQIEVSGVWERPWVLEWGARVSEVMCRISSRT